MDALWCLHGISIARSLIKHHQSWELGILGMSERCNPVRAAHGAAGDAAGAYRAPIGFCSSLRSLLPGEGTGAPKARTGTVSVSATGVSGGSGAAPAVHEGLQRDLGVACQWGWVCLNSSVTSCELPCLLQAPSGLMMMMSSALPTAKQTMEHQQLSTEYASSDHDFLV